MHTPNCAQDVEHYFDRYQTSLIGAMDVGDLTNERLSMVVNLNSNLFPIRNDISIYNRVVHQMKAKCSDCGNTFEINYHSAYPHVCSECQFNNYLAIRGSLDNEYVDATIIVSTIDEFYLNINGKEFKL